MVKAICIDALRLARDRHCTNRPTVDRLVAVHDDVCNIQYLRSFYMSNEINQKFSSMVGDADVDDDGDDDDDENDGDENDADDDDDDEDDDGDR